MPFRAVTQNAAAANFLAWSRTSAGQGSTNSWKRSALPRYKALMAAAAHGDADAYGELVSHTSPLVSSIALAMVRDLELSRDIAQEVFLAAWRDLKSLRNPASFLPWLRQMARNRARVALRNRT